MKQGPRLPCWFGSSDVSSFTSVTLCKALLGTNGAAFGLNCDLLLLIDDELLGVWLFPILSGVAMTVIPWGTGFAVNTLT